jgi:ketosteroid isomerase-like protein
MVNAKDLDGLMMMYTGDAITMPVNEPMISDKAAIRTYQDKRRIWGSQVLK